jgi:transcriptional regulator GlxA family with amidase domain
MQPRTQEPANPPRTFSIALVCVEPALHAALLSIEPFRAANRLSRSPLFQIAILSADNDSETSRAALPGCTASLDDSATYDLVLLHSSYEFNGDKKGARCSDGSADRPLPGRISVLSMPRRSSWRRQAC